MSKRTWLLYVHTNKINNKKYVGITSTATKQRWANGSGYKGQTFYNAIEKYGWDNFDHEVIVNGLTEEEADYWERLYIKELNSKSPSGYNVTDGGDAKSMDRSHLIGEKATNIKPIICLNNMRVFPYAKMACEEYSIFPASITACVNGRYTAAGKDPITKEPLLWSHYDENLPIEHYEEIKLDLIKKRSVHGSTKVKKCPPQKVICLTTGEIFDSMTQANKKHNANGVRQCVMGRQSFAGITDTGIKLKWMYYEEYLKLNNNRREAI